MCISAKPHFRINSRLKPNRNSRHRCCGPQDPHDVQASRSDQASPPAGPAHPRRAGHGPQAVHRRLCTLPPGSSGRLSSSNIIKKVTPRPSRGFCLCGRNPCLLAALKERMYGLAHAKSCYLLPVNGSTSSIVSWPLS